MDRQFTITERVKFLIKHIIGQGYAANQEDLGLKIGISNKSYLSQLVNNRIPNEKFIESLLNIAPNFNKEWLYNKDIDTPFLDDETEIILKKENLSQAIPTDYEAILQEKERIIAEQANHINTLKQSLNMNEKVIDVMSETLKRTISGEQILCKSQDVG